MNSIKEDINLTVGQSITLAQIETEGRVVELVVTRTEEDLYKLAYKWCESGDPLLMMTYSEESGSSQLHADRLDTSFWNLIVDGDERPVEELQRILQTEFIANTDVKVTERRIELETR